MDYCSILKLSTMLDNKGKTTWPCLKLVTEYHNDVPTHVLEKEHLYNCIRSIFSSIEWWQTLFQRTAAHETDRSFGQNLISAAANHEMRVVNLNTINPFYSLQYEINSNEQIEQPLFELIDFSSKIPSPP